MSACPVFHWDACQNFVFSTEELRTDRNRTLLQLITKAQITKGKVETIAIWNQCSLCRYNSQANENFNQRALLILRLLIYILKCKAKFIAICDWKMFSIFLGQFILSILSRWRNVKFISRFFCRAVYKQRLPLHTSCSFRIASFPNRFLAEHFTEFLFNIAL